MPSSIINAAPMVQQLGIKDNSTTQGAVRAANLPSHLPLNYIYAQKGPTGLQLVGDNLVSLYGSDTFDERKAYATHQTVLVNTLSAAGNAQMIERVVPADAGPKPNFLLSLDVLATDIPLYQRGDDGVYLRDQDGALIPEVGDTTTPGYRVKWVKTSITSGGPATPDSTTFGVAVSGPGDQVDGATTSTLYPVLQFYSGSYGAGGNNAGLRLMAPLVTDDGPVNTAVMNALQAYPFRLQAISRVSSVATPTITPTLVGDASIDFVLKAGQIDPYTNAKISLADVFKDAYQVIGNPLRPDVYADIPNVHLYTANIATLQNLFLTGEKAAITALSDTVGSDIAANEAAANAFKFNILSFRNSSGAQYRCIEENVTDTNAIQLGAATNLYCGGGSDGTMSDALFNGLVRTKLAEYADPNAQVLDTATNPISIMYDSGFELETKYSMCNLLAFRKDTFVVLSPYTQGTEISATEEASIGVALRTRLGLFPESTFFGTPVVRGLIMARYGRMLTSQYAHKLPLTLELASKAAQFMGAGDGVWNASKLFDRAPRSEVTMFTELNSSFTPATQRVVDWSHGLNYPIAFSRDTLFFPALRTAYNDDTSVLTSFFTAMGCVQLQKVGEQVWREFSGAVSLTRAQLVANVNQSVIDKTTGKFAGLFKIVPKAFISGGDEKRGYSYTLPIEIYANNAQTVMTLSVEAYRRPAE